MIWLTLPDSWRLEMATLTAAQRLVEAQDAYHRLMLGRSMVECRDANGDMTVYARADASRLKAYIETLKREVAGDDSCPGPIHPFF